MSKINHMFIFDINLNIRAYGHLDYRSTENKVVSGLSTALSEAWLLSRVGRQVQAITGSSALSWSNLAAARVSLTQANFQILDLARDFTRSFPLLNLATRQVIAPSVGEIARNLNTARLNLQTAALRRENIDLLLKGAGARTFFQQALYRISPRLLPYTLRLESFFAGRAFAAAQKGLLIATEAAEAAATAVASTAGVQIGLVVALGFSVGAGIGTAIAYGIGTYDQNFTPQDAVKKFIPALKLFWG